MCQGLCPFLPESELVMSVPFAELGYVTSSDSLDRTFLLLPGHRLGMALFNFYYNYGTQKLCKARNLEQRECNQVCEYCTRKFSLWQDAAWWAWVCSQGRTNRATIVSPCFHGPQQEARSIQSFPHGPSPSPWRPRSLLTWSVLLPVLGLRVCLLWFRGSPL